MEPKEWSDLAPFKFHGIAAPPHRQSLSPPLAVPSLVKSQRNALDSGVTVQSPALSYRPNSTSFSSTGADNTFD